MVAVVLLQALDAGKYMITVLVADDHAMVVDALRAELARG